MGRWLFDVPSPSSFIVLWSRSVRCAYVPAILMLAYCIQRILDSGNLTHPFDSILILFSLSFVGQHPLFSFPSFFHSRRHPLPSPLICHRCCCYHQHPFFLAPVFYFHFFVEILPGVLPPQRIQYVDAACPNRQTIIFCPHCEGLFYLVAGFFLGTWECFYCTRLF